MTFPIPHGITECAIPCGASHTAMPVFQPKLIRWPQGCATLTLGFTVPRRWR